MTCLIFTDNSFGFHNQLQRKEETINTDCSYVNSLRLKCCLLVLE